MMIYKCCTYIIYLYICLYIYLFVHIFVHNTYIHIYIYLIYIYIYVCVLYYCIMHFAIYIYLYILSPLLGDKCVYREHIKIPEQWGNLLGYVAFTGSKWGSLGDLPALAMATINCFKKKRIWIPCPYHHCFFFFLHGSFGLNSKWGYINPTYCTMIVVGVSTSITLGPI